MSKIGMSGQLTEFDVPMLGSAPYGITVGPDGNVWFTEEQAATVGLIHTLNIKSYVPLILALVHMTV